MLGIAWKENPPTVIYFIFSFFFIFYRAMMNICVYLRCFVNFFWRHLPRTICLFFADHDRFFNSTDIWAETAPFENIYSTWDFCITRDKVVLSDHKFFAHFFFFLMKTWQVCKRHADYSFCTYIKTKWKILHVCCRLRFY